MKPFSRKVEKILAWIANVIMILVTVLLSLGAFSSQLTTAFKQKEFEPILYNLLQDPGVESLLKSSGLDIVSLLVLLVKIYTVVAIVALLLALIASFTMKARIVSGILFLLSAIVIGVMTVGILLPVYLLYFIVAIMLFAKRPPKNTDNSDFTQTTSEKPEIDRLEYM
ncbi:DUF4064 domain-containing protein [uncultured Gemella sp.]|uniref:DUF4064 domain-containing protein n=1 Tax=uncultured Gemella sp. TaxID=254352 RepID=UPI0025EFB08A|nr:DUF4064 domain-containing protein [uncultured Gemella sp.]